MEEELPEDRINDSEGEGERQIVELKNYNTEGKEAPYVQIDQIIGVTSSHRSKENSRRNY